MKQLNYTITEYNTLRGIKWPAKIRSNAPAPTPPARITGNAATASRIIAAWAKPRGACSPRRARGHMIAPYFAFTRIISESDKLSCPVFATHICPAMLPAPLFHTAIQYPEGNRCHFVLLFSPAFPSHQTGRRVRRT